MEASGVIFEVTRLLWVVFVCAAPVAIWLMAVGKTAAARRLVFGEIVLTLALVFLGLALAAGSGSHGAGWDAIGMLLWGLNALFVAGATAAILVVMFIARKSQDPPEE